MFGRVVEKTCKQVLPLPKCSLTGQPALAGIYTWLFMVGSGTAGGGWYLHTRLTDMEKGKAEERKETASLRKEITDFRQKMGDEVSASLQEFTKDIHSGKIALEGCGYVRRRG